MMTHLGGFLFNPEVESSGYEVEEEDDSLGSLSKLVMKKAEYAKLINVVAQLLPKADSELLTEERVHFDHEGDFGNPFLSLVGPSI